MATFHVTWTLDNRIGTTAIKVKYRLSGTSVWTQFLVAASGTTADISGCENNLLYDFQYVNINGADNPSSIVVQSIGFTDPDPIFSPINRSISYQFDNLSADIDTYTSTIALYESPGEIIDTHILTPADPVEDTFSSLAPLTDYIITITPAANQFYETFTYLVSTTDALCAQPQNTVAELI